MFDMALVFYIIGLLSYVAQILIDKVNESRIIPSKFC